MTEEALMDITPAARQGLLTDAKSEAMKAKEDESKSDSISLSISLFLFFLAQTISPPVYFSSFSCLSLTVLPSNLSLP